MAEELTEQAPIAPGEKRRRVAAAALALLLAATAFAGWAGWSWLSAATDDSIEYAQARDAALEAGREHLVTLTSLDHAHVDEGIHDWLGASTGALREKLAATSEETRTTLRTAGTVATGAVLDAGITELDEHAGTATMLAAVEITITGQGGAPAPKRNRFTVELARTESGWKLSGLNQLPLASG